MMAPAAAAKVGSRTRLVWSSPPPPSGGATATRVAGKESRGNKEGNCNDNKGGKQL